MATSDLGLLPGHRNFLERLVAACDADERVLAVLLGGSYARGTADAFSDIDLTIVTTDEAFDGFFDRRAAFLGRLGELVLLEDFDHPDISLAIYADGVEVEVNHASAGRLTRIHCGPFRILLDKPGILANAAFPQLAPSAEEQTEQLRRMLAWFWHDLSHFTTAMARGHLWWAYGQLEELRRECLNLARLRHDFAAPTDAHEKVDQALPAAMLAPLAASCCPFEPDAILAAGRALVMYYQDAARPLAAAHGLAYPAELERVMLARLDALI